MVGQIRFLALISAFLLSSGSYAADSPKKPGPVHSLIARCFALLNPTQLPTSIEETEGFRELLRQVKEGQKPFGSIQLTPANREVSLRVFDEKGNFSWHHGRIERVLPRLEGEIEILFSKKKTSDGVRRIAETFLLSRIDIDYATVRKVLFPGDYELIKAKLQEAFRAGKAVSYVDQYDMPRRIIGRVKRLCRKQTSDEIIGFIFEEDNGLECFRKWRSVDPSSIKFL